MQNFRRICSLSLTAIHPFRDRPVRLAVYLSVILSVLDSSLLPLRRLGYRLYSCSSRPARLHRKCLQPSVLKIGNDLTQVARRQGCK